MDDRMRAQDVRLLLGASAVLSVTQAISLLPLGHAAAARWLRRNGLVRDLDGRGAVIWGDVLETLRGEEPGHEPRRSVPIYQFKKTSR